MSATQRQGTCYFQMAWFGGEFVSPFSRSAGALLNLERARVTSKGLMAKYQI